MAEKTPEKLAPEQQLKYQTWVLKVSIHCEGCRKKVKKVLQAIHGVYEIEIDPKQHKVTVTGNVEADTLLKKLIRSGKQAELWPLPEQNKENSQDKEDGEDDEEEEEDQDQKKPGQAEAGQNAAVGVGGGGKKKKKKKKKKKVGQTPNGIDPNSGGGTNGEPANIADVASPVIGIDPGAGNQGLPVHQVYSHAPVYSYVPPPVYGSNYSTAYHTTTDSYYAHQYPGQPVRRVVQSYPGKFGPLANPIIRTDEVYYDNEMESGCSIM